MATTQPVGSVFSYGDIALYAAQHSDWTSTQIAKAMVDALDTETLRQLARSHVQGFVEEIRRDQAREAETRAVRVVESANIVQPASKVELRKALDAINADRWSGLIKSVMEIENAYAAQIRLEVTEELLGTVFALGDGVKTTWGDATIEQHEQRISMLTGMAATTVETASRHRAAVTMIRSSGATCLRQLTG